MESLDKAKMNFRRGALRYMKTSTLKKEGFWESQRKRSESRRKWISLRQRTNLQFGIFGGINHTKGGGENKIYIKRERTCVGEGGTQITPCASGRV